MATQHTMATQQLFEFECDVTPPPQCGGGRAVSPGGGNEQTGPDGPLTRPLPRPTSPRGRGDDERPALNALDIASLQANIAGLTVAGLTTATHKTVDTFSTGCEVLDAWLPGGGLACDGVTEWIDGSPAISGGASLAFWAANQASPSRRIVVVDPEGTFYPPAAIAMGIDADRMIWCQPESPADTVWSIDQALRCRHVGAVVAWVDRRLDDRDARRFQLAAEVGRTPGLLIRPAAVRGKPSFAKVRFHVTSPPINQHHEQIRSTKLASARFFRVTLDRAKGTTAGRQMTIAIDAQSKAHVVPETLLRQIVHHRKAARAPLPLHLASQLADPAAKKPASGRSRAG